MEVRHGRRPGSTSFRFSIETAKGLRNVHEIAQACTGRKVYLGLGIADLAVDLHIEASRDESQFLFGHSTVIAAARAAGLEAPLDSVWLDMDIEGLKASTKRGMALGYQGKTCFHVSHVPIINEIYTPAEAEVERAKRIVAAYEEATAKGQASFQLDGKLIDLPVVLRAKQTVERMQAIQARVQK
jgi:citrate lyase subunit beta/citryl-CoA lyase